MSSLDLLERRALAPILELAIREDLGPAGDVTSLATIPAHAHGKAVFIARSCGVFAGLPVCAKVIERVDPTLRFEALLEDGARLEKGYWLATVEGSMRSILAAERTALNFLQRLSGIATLTRQYVDAVAGTQAKVLDTRKTLPGWRVLDKYAVRVGGGVNHRMGLFDAVLIKDNHLAAIRQEEGGRRDEIAVAIGRCKEINPTSKIEIEVDNPGQLDEALRSEPDVVLLDNMSIEQLREAVARRNALANSVQLEASGGVNLQTVRAIAETGVDRISVGAITHSAAALDIALDYLD